MVARTKIFELEKNNLKLKIEIYEKSIFTSWLHENNDDFSNIRKFDISDLNFAFDTLKPVCNMLEILEIEKFMFEKKEGEQFSLF